MPGSRSQSSVERSKATAGRQEPLRREQERGPQHEVNPAASSDSQGESRVGHVTAKATSVARRSGGGSAADLSGVWGAARAQGSVGNRRGPSAQPASGKGRSYKPSAKASGAQRESEGIIVPGIGAEENAPGGKDPCFGGAGASGKREGMVERKARPNHPGGSLSTDKVRQLQRRLWVAAKRQPGRRFHALYDRIYRGDVLWEAWRRVRSNGGSAGVDAETLAEVEQGAWRFSLGSFKPNCERVGTDRWRFCGGTYRRPTEGGGRWGYRR